LALLVASYTDRGTWLACGSTAMSIAVLVGCIVFSRIEVPGQFESGLMQLASQLSPVLGQRTLDDVTAVIEQFSTNAICNEKERPGCVTPAGRIEPPTFPDGDRPRRAEMVSAAPQAIQAASTTGWPEAKTNSNDVARSPVIWLFDEPDAPVSPGIAPGLSITGINVSDETLMRVHGTLKPDSSQRELELALSQEQKLDGETVIPAGARFSLGTPNPNSSIQGGAIFTFRYVYAGRERASFMYLTPAMIARSANRG
jgi:hypothetical protein